MSRYDFVQENDFWKVNELGNGVLEVLFNRPEKRNAINHTMEIEWAQVLDVAEDDDDVRVVTVRGEGKVFTAGGDMKAGAEGYVRDGVSSGIPRHQIPHLPRAWYFRKPIVAGVHGYVGPAGCDFLGSCDFVIAAEGTRFGFEALRLGGEGTTSSIISMQLPMRVMKKLFLMGGWFDAEQALEWQFVQRVVEQEQVEAETNRWAEELCKIPTTSHRAAKEMLHRIYELQGLLNIKGVGNHLSGHVDNERDAEFFRMVEEIGMKKALAFRDAQFDSELGKV